jgi:hypothetical protein
VFRGQLVLLTSSMALLAGWTVPLDVGSLGSDLVVGGSDLAALAAGRRWLGAGANPVTVASSLSNSGLWSIRVSPMTRARVDGGSDIADQHIAEDAAAKQMLLELERIGPDDVRFPHLLEELRQAVLLHAFHEEAHEFRYLKDGRDGGTVVTTGMIKAAEAIAPTHRHPSINSATANNVAGPVVSLFGRTRDLVRKAIDG